eukprot:TRINITY_DN8957_c0_g1_i3.p1 TRINITY_DN8957_c0_g1~~TRINITY_DN8957_c0_g1_i3.p1  ORF type:complete len:103 (+),score=5.65 TRINITY_DN8957_c0_g1_i3:574-882(+)
MSIWRVTRNKNTLARIVDAIIGRKIKPSFKYYVNFLMSLRSYYPEEDHAFKRLTKNFSGSPDELFALIKIAIESNCPLELSLIHICRCRRSTLCRSRWSPYH